MEQTYEIRVERSRLALMLRFLGWIFAGTVITTCIGRFATFFLILAACCGVATEIVLEKMCGSYRVVCITFLEECVKLKFKYREINIFYNDIKEVGKMMMLTQYAPEKGNYQLKIKTKNRSYRFFTPMEDYEKHLDFEQTEFAAVYKAFGKYGVTCN